MTYLADFDDEITIPDSLLPSASLLDNPLSCHDPSFPKDLCSLDSDDFTFTLRIGDRSLCLSYNDFYPRVDDFKEFVQLVESGNACKIHTYGCGEHRYEARYIVFDKTHFTFGIFFNGCDLLHSSFDVPHSESVMKLLREALHLLENY